MFNLFNWLFPKVELPEAAPQWRYSYKSKTQLAPKKKKPKVKKEKSTTPRKEKKKQPKKRKAPK